MFLKRLRLPSLNSKDWLGLTSWLLYVLLFNPLYHIVGPTAVALATLPLLATGGRLGTWGSMALGALAFPLNLLLLKLTGTSVHALLSINGLVGSSLLVLIGGVMGRMHKLSGRAKRAAAQRERAESDTSALAEEFERTIQGLQNQIFRYRRREDGEFIATLSEGQLAEAFDATTEQISGKTLREVVGEEKAPHFYPYYKRAFAGETVKYESEFKGRYFATTLAPFNRAPDGSVVEIVGSVEDITERKRAEEARVHHLQELTTLHAVSQALASSLELDDILQEALSRTVDMLDVTGCLITLTEKDDDTLKLFSHIGVPKSLIEATQEEKLDKTLCRVVYDQGQLLSLDDLREGAPTPVDIHLAAGLRSYTGVPIIHKGNIRGVLSIFNATPHCMSESDRGLLTAIGQQIGVAVENARLFEKTQVALAETRTLHHATRSLISHENLSEMLQIVVDSVVEALSADRVTLITLDMEGKHITHFVKGGPGSDQVIDVSFKELWDGLTGWALRNLQPALSSKDIPDPRESTEVQGRRAETNCGAIIVAPMFYRGKILGTVTAINRPDQRDFTHHDVDLMVALVNQAAAALENARLLQETQRRAIQLTAAAEVSRHATAILDVDQLLNVSVNLISEQFGFGRVGIFLIEEETKELYTAAVTDQLWEFIPKDYHQPIGKGAMGKAAATGEVVCVSDASTDPIPYAVGKWLSPSSLSIPIQFGGMVIGVLEVESDLINAFSESDQAALKVISDQIASAIQNGRLFEETKRRVRELQMLHEVALAAASSVHLEETLHAAARALSNEMGDVQVALMLLDPQDGSLHMTSHAGYSSSEVKRTSFQPGEGIIGWVAQHGEPMLVRDVRQNPHYIEMIPEIRSELCVPLKSEQQVIGILNVESPHLDDFTYDDQRLMTTLANNLVILIERARLFEEIEESKSTLERQAKDLRTLYKVAAAGATELNLDDILQHSLTTLQEALQPDDIAILLLDPEMEELVIRAWGGFPGGPKLMRRQIGVGIPGWVVEQGEPVLVDDVRQDWRYHACDAETRAELCAPLRVGEKIIGALNLESRETGKFDEDDMRLISTLAGNLAVLIERAQLFNELSTARTKLQQRAEALEKANARLKELDRLKSQFLASMSHELRTPLNSILGFSEVLLDGLVGEVPNEQRDCLNNIHSSGKHLLALINDVLDLSKIEAGRMELELSTFAVSELILEVQATTLPLIEKKSQTLHVEAEENLPPLTADRIRIRQVLLNLLSNAYKFTPTGGEITLLCRSTDSAGMLFSVKDTGIGIKPENQEVIFEEFRQIEEKSLQEVSGTGLGLAISKRLIAMHGGNIWVESEYGHGSTFSFLIPLGGPTELEMPTDAHAVPQDAKKVLVVEDNRQFSNLLSFYLRQEGYEPIQHYDGRRVLELAREIQPDWITLDIMLPEQDGWQVLQALKSDPQTKEIPVLVVSALENSDLALGLGAVDYLVKPVRREDLHNLLERMSVMEPPTRKVKVLVVDDDVDFLPLIGEMLPDNSYEVLTASNGHKGLALARSENPDIILLDLLMPGISGFEVLEKLQSNEQTKNIPVVVLTAMEVRSKDRKRLNDHIQGLMHKTALTPQSLMEKLCDLDH